jgi:hypothetical protein
MLKPFRIRNLLDSSPEPELASPSVNHGAHGTEQARTTLDIERGLVEDIVYCRANGKIIFPRPEAPRDGIVQVSAGEYDKTISSHPQSKLSYMDNDDGELITVSHKIQQNSRDVCVLTSQKVGSSLELAQRLDEPVDNSLCLFETQEPGGLGPMHIFDIRRSSPTLDIWRAIEARTMARFKAAVPITSSFDQDSRVEGSSTVDSSENCNTADHNFDKGRSGPTLDQTHDDIRQRWFRACNPPQLSAAPRSAKDEDTRTEIQKVDQSIREEFLPEARIDAMTKNGSTLCTTAMPSSTPSSPITEEGKRQVLLPKIIFRIG